MAKKIRLDEFLLQNSLADDLAQARSLILAGVVYQGEERCHSAGQQVMPAANIEVRGKYQPYVSRGGHKLQKAVEVFEISLKGAVAMDVGASTGGFTDCMLQNGATKVYSVDVGYGQLAWKLRSDKRVVNMERTNIRNVVPEDLDELLDFASVDVAFISLNLVLPVVKRLLKPAAQAVALIKPQFEARRSDVPTGGVVRDPAVHAQVIGDVNAFAADNGFCALALTYSPIRGPEGNIEYLIHLQNRTGQDCGGDAYVSDAMVADVVAQAHAELGGST